MNLTKLPRPLRTALLSAVWNLSFGFFNILTAVTAHSYWHLTLAAFFLLLMLAAGLFIRARRII